MKAVEIKIELWEWSYGRGDTGHVNSNRPRTISNIAYGVAVGTWNQADYIGDPDGYGYARGDGGGAGDAEIYFEISQNDYDGDGLAYWEEVNSYGTNPREDNRGEDSDGDGIPIEWEDKWGYDPTIWDDHLHLDPDNDGLENIDEYFTSQWGSDPFYKDIFVEVDWMPGHELTSEAKSLVINAFARYNIALHIDDGCMGGGGQVPYDDTLSSSERDTYYRLYFLNNNPNNPRKEIFHYALFADEIQEGRAGIVDGDPNRRGMLTVADGMIKSPLSQAGQFFVFTDLTTAIAGTFMHELGHTLGLGRSDFSGIDNDNSKFLWQADWWTYANYKSCMNYRYIWSLVDYSDGSHGSNDFNDWGTIDLSYFA